MENQRALSSGCTIAMLQAQTRLVVQGRIVAVEAACAALGLARAPDMLRSDAGAHGAVWRLGPYELMVLPAGDGVELLERGLAGLPHSVVNVSDRQIAFCIDGPQATQILSGLCPLDCALAAFPVGMVTRSLLDKADATLLRLSETSFRIETWRSFAPYVVTMLNAVAEGVEFACLSV